MHVCRYKTCFISTQINALFLFGQNLALILMAFKYILSHEQKRRELMSWQLESKKETSVRGRVAAKAPSVPAHELCWANRGQEILLLPQSPTSLSPICPGLRVETELTPTSPSPFTNVHELLCVGDTVASEDVQLALTVPPLHPQEGTPPESSDSVTPSASAYLALLTMLICCCMTLQGEIETNMTSLLQ